MKRPIRLHKKKKINKFKCRLVVDKQVIKMMKETKIFDEILKGQCVIKKPETFYYGDKVK